MPWRRRWLAVLAALALASAAGARWYFQSQALPPPPGNAPLAAVLPPEPSFRNDLPSATGAKVAASPANTAPLAGAPHDPTAEENGPEGERLERMFPTLPNGQLRLDGRTKLNLEKLLVLNTPAQLRAKLMELETTLPQAAFGELNDLLERYRNYSAAAEQMYPAGQAPADANAALAQLQALHDLRVTYFGPATAQALYAKEEQLTRQLLQVMRLDTQTGLTLEQKAERAQQLLQPQ